MRRYRGNHGDKRHTRHAGFCALPQKLAFSVTWYFLFSATDIFAHRMLLLCNILAHTSRANADMNDHSRDKGKTREGAGRAFANALPAPSRVFPLSLELLKNVLAVA
jgi:hypothetical protein